MELLPLSQTPNSNSGQIFCASQRFTTESLSRLLCILFLLIWPCVSFVFFDKSTVNPVIFFSVVGIVLLVAVFFFYKFFLRNNSRACWILMLDKSGIYINRPAEFYYYSKKRVLYIPLNEIRYVQKSRRNASVQAQGELHSEQVSIVLTFLDICLYDCFESLLSQSLIDNDVRIKNETTATNVTSKYMEAFDDNRVTLRNPSTLRIRFDNLTPEIINAILYFHKNKVRVDEDRVDDFSDHPEERQQMEKIIARLALDGNRSEAIKLAQETYGIDDSEAVQLIEQVQKRL